MEILKAVNLNDIIDILDIVGVLAFAISGAFKGMKANLDILGVVVLGVITALGGGILRDVLMNSIPASLINERDLYLAIISSIMAYLLGGKIQNFVPIIKIFDAAGLAVFTIIGAEKGMSGELGILGIVIMGALTGVAGGVIRDLLVTEIPFVLKEEIYAMFCIVGAFIYFVMIKWLCMDKNVVILIVISLIFFGRVMAIKYDLHLPRRQV